MPTTPVTYYAIACKSAKPYVVGMLLVTKKPGEPSSQEWTGEEWTGARTKTWKTAEGEMERRNAELFKGVGA